MENNASNNAGVTVVIIGLKPLNYKFDKMIFPGNDIIKSQNINPYLANVDNIIIQKQNANLNVNFPEMVKGSSPTDGGGLLLNLNEYNQIIKEYPEVKGIFKHYIGSEEFINSLYRFCIWFQNDEEFEVYKNYYFLQKRLEIVRQARLNSSANSTIQYSSKPHLFKVRGERS